MMVIISCVKAIGMRNKVKPLKDQLKRVRWGVLDYLAFIK
jgi:hypothetical protein